jgi:formylglycine-generating enzyme required for sulfatase activity
VATVAQRRGRWAALFGLVVLVPALGFAQGVGSAKETAGAGGGEEVEPAVLKETEGEPGEHPEKAAPLASTSAKPVRMRVPEKDGMLLLPGGKFVMGSADPKSQPYERPAHAMKIAAFWLDRTEVTVRDYRTCVDAHVCSAPQLTSAQCTYPMSDANLPVTCVRFAQAQEYCRFRTRRLPHEAEWEFAARGTQNLKFPWGPNAPMCGFAATVGSETTGKTCTPGRPAPVGSYLAGAGPFGVLDLAGNVEEWTDDVFRGAIPSTGSAPAVVVGAENHVLRGGSWMMPPRFARTTSRNWGSATEAGPGVGIRCARDVKDDEIAMVSSVRAAQKAYAAASSSSTATR